MKDTISLRAKLLISFLCVGIIPFTIMAIISLTKAKIALEDQAFSQLQSMRDVKKGQVLSYLETIKSQVLTFSEDHMVIMAMSQFSEKFDSFLPENNIEPNDIKKLRDKLGTYYKNEFTQAYKEENKGVAPDAGELIQALDDETIALQYHYIRANKNPLGSKDLLDKAEDSSGYSRLHSRYHPTIRNYLKKFGYYDIFLVHPETGKIIYSVFKELDFATSLTTGPYSDTNFADAFRKANAADSNDYVVFTDFKQYLPSYEAPAGFVASPVFSEGKKTGVLIFQFPIDNLNKIMEERSGMGKSGETYLVGSDMLMRSDSYLDPENHSVGASFRHPETGKVDTEASRDALRGNTDEKIVIDYNGNPVLSAYVPLVFEDLQWVLLAEIDESEAFAAINTIKWLIMIISIVSIGVIFGFAWVIARSISKPINVITQGMSDGANQVASASSEVSSSSQSMADGASQQTVSLGETSSSMEAMSSMTRKTAENASHANTLMKEANLTVTTANESMGKLTLSMEDISSASEETSKIIKTIDEIAFQTNLLALNAAVEAARAGEAGAGFAVVADEVRNLAMRAADAAKNTAELIEGTLTKVNDGSELVSITNNAFGDVAKSAAKVGTLVAEISEASNEQSNGIDQVNRSISEMDKVVQQNAANAEESAAASEEMNAQAEQLRRYVGELVRLVTGKKDQGTSSPLQLNSLIKQKP